ncbi:hypothetical protein CHS0354_026881 [Potamilus streckersoni]|uniref:Uncharacterized protein n=1 Tax=Potamilus streckersoni TaxID=2493646 RepID=A0AAE0SPK0_9BIVA|nr:hypothetical protein CHS0354_026881 [Potamilus streckersoni]
MAELSQATVLTEQSIATTAKTDFSMLSTILDEVKQLKDEVKFANSKQNQDINYCSQIQADINVTKQQFRPQNSNYQQRSCNFRENKISHQIHQLFQRIILTLEENIIEFQDWFNLV